MKKLSLVLITLAFLSTLIISSCGKYEDGPAFSMRSKKSRLTGEWTIESTSINGVDNTAAFTTAVGANYMFEIEKDGTYRTAGTFSDTGKWELGEDKDDIFLTSNATGSKQVSYRITRLKSKELWVKQTQSNGDIWVFKYKQ